MRTFDPVGFAHIDDDRPLPGADGVTEAMCDDCKFRQATKELLEKEAGFRCGHPSCKVRTVAASNSSKSGLSQVGQAAHIAAASAGGKRYDSSMSHDTRSAPANGIWMCEYHAKLIDTDENRFPAYLLHRWKRQLRHLGQRALDHRLDFAAQAELIPLQRRKPLRPDLGDSEMAEFVKDFLDDIGARFVWGDEVSESARVALTELLFNEARHGAGTWARLDSLGFAVRLTTDGLAYSLRDLGAATTARGGQATIGVFQDAHADTHVLTYQRPSGNRQRYLITDIRRNPAKYNPCSLTTAELHDPAVIERVANCPEVHVYLVKAWTVSGGNRDLGPLGALPSGTGVVLHVPNGPMVAALIRMNSHLSIRIAGAG